MLLTDPSVIIVEAMKRSAAKRKPAKKGATKLNGDVRAEKAVARKEAILAAALDEFSAQGFAAARLDDVAARAGVAKGTIYLHFKDKEDLFQELIRTALSPFVQRVEAAPSVNMPFRAVAEMLVGNFVREVLSTKRKNIIRLVISEGRRFPKISEFYYREVVSRASVAMRQLVRLGIARGELRHDALEQFPQLIIAPALVAIVWDDLFERFEHLDPEAMLKAHFEILFSPPERKAS
jgi:AcrR family transcriptional regulator